MFFFFFVFVTGALFWKRGLLLTYLTGVQTFVHKALVSLLLSEAIFAQLQCWTDPRLWGSKMLAQIYRTFLFIYFYFSFLQNWSLTNVSSVVYLWRLLCLLVHPNTTLLIACKNYRTSGTLIFWDASLICTGSSSHPLLPRRSQSSMHISQIYCFKLLYVLLI